MTTATTLDPQKSEAFAGRLLGYINGAGLAMMISIGHRTGLFDALADGQSRTSDELATTAGLDERYVREWLGAMTTGALVDHDAETKRFRLPAEHAAWLTREASPQNMAVTAQFVSVLGGVEDDIVTCFREGGGVPYDAFPRFHEVMAEESAQTVLAPLEDAILPLVPGLIERLESGIDVLDIGCGRGRAMIQLAARFPKSTFTGYDISEEAITDGRREAQAKGLDNVRLEVQDVANLPGTTFDLVTAFDAIHDQAAPATVLSEIASSLRPGGVFLMQDIHASSHVEKNLEHPLAPFLYTISAMHCMTVSLAADGDGLGTCWGEEKAVSMLKDAGFGSVDVSRLEHDIQNNYYVAQLA